VNTFTKVALKGCAGLIVEIAAASCHAIDYQPGDWVPVPPQTSVFMGYYEFGTRNEYNNTITGTAKNNTHLDSNIGVARYLYYNEVLHHPYVLDFIAPFGALTDGKINGKNLGSASGLGDPMVSGGFWFIDQPKQRRYLSAADFLTLPLGTYDIWSCASQNFSERPHFAPGKWALSKRGSLERRSSPSPSSGNLNSARGQIEPAAPGC
jgi:hypothetical protein